MGNEQSGRSRESATRQGAANPIHCKKEEEEEVMREEKEKELVEEEVIRKRGGGGQLPCTASQGGGGSHCRHFHSMVASVLFKPYRCNSKKGFSFSAKTVTYFPVFRPYQQFL